MRHGRLIGALALGMLVLGAGNAAAQDDRDINVRRMVLAETQIQPAAQQLVQVTLANTGRKAVLAGLRAELRDGRDRRVGSPQTRQVTLPGKDEQRFLFRFTAPSEPGDYAVRFEVLSGDFKQPLIPGGPVFFSPFRVGEGRPRPAPVAAQQARIVAPSFVAPSGLSFERADLLWENLTVSPPSLLLGETLKIRADLRNVGGDIAREVQVRVLYFNTRTPSRTETISQTTVNVMAPGEKLEMEFDTVFPDDALLGEYRVTLLADAADGVDELDERNNEATTNPIRLSRIKLIFPEPDFAFEEQGLFLFRWDSLRFDEFKVQVGTDLRFADPADYFDLPQGDKWSKDKEIVPLEGELPVMAQGLMEKTSKTTLFWRVVGRDSGSGRTVQSPAQPFSIKPEPRPRETQPPVGTPPAGTPPAGEGTPGAMPGSAPPQG